MFEDQIKMVSQVRETYADKFMHQQPTTPIELIKDITDQIPFDGNASVLVMFTIEWALYLKHVGYKDITVAAQGTDAIAKFCQYFGFKYINLDEKNNKMKFDVVVGNPPYVGDLHLKFLKKAIDISTNYVAFVHPAAWLVKLSEKSALESECVQLVSQYQCKFKFIKGKHYFGVAQYAPCSITVLNKDLPASNTDIEIYDESCDRVWKFAQLTQVNVLSDSPSFFELSDFLKKTVKDSVADLFGRTGKFYVEIPKIRGSSTSQKSKRNVNHTDFYTIIPKDCNIKTSRDVIGKKNVVGFETEQEAHNFINFLKTDFARFCIALLKFDANIQKSKLRYVPALDFKRQWYDADLNEHFNISPDWAKVIQAVIPKYYD